MLDVTFAQLVERARRWLVGTHGVPQNRLTAAIDDEQVNIELDYATGVLVAGNYIAVDYEILYVWEVQSANKEAVVSRGALGTEAVAHAVGAEVESMSRFPRPVILQSVIDEITAWPETLFQPKTKNLDVALDAGVVDLGIRDDELRLVLDVKRAPRVSRGWTSDRWVPMSYRVDRMMPRTEFSSGAALVLTTKVSEPSTLRVLYGAPFDLEDVDQTSDAVEDCGLRPSMLDIPPIGAASRLMHAREIQRTDTEALGETRIPAEVPATYQSQTAMQLRRLADKRINDEALRLRSLYGIHS